MEKKTEKNEFRCKYLPVSVIVEVVCGRQPSVRPWHPPAGEGLLLGGPAAKQYRFPRQRRAWQPQQVTNNGRNSVAIQNTRQFIFSTREHGFTALYPSAKL